MSAYVVYADEAWTHDPGLRFWRFYGGAMLLASDRERIERELLELQARLGIPGEIKWTKVRPFNWERVAVVLDRFLDFVQAGEIKLRYMWLDQMFQTPDALTEYHRRYGYYILYYFFLVLAFGLPYHDSDEIVDIARFLPDKLPDEPEKRREFEQFLCQCHQLRRYHGHSQFRISNVGEAHSHDHIILQCVDVIIGAVGFRLNHMHKAKQPNGRRAEATKVKEKLYERIRDRLGEIDMGERGGQAFAIGVNTGKGSDFANLWRHKFRQWGSPFPRAHTRALR